MDDSRLSQPVDLIRVSFDHVDVGALASCVASPGAGAVVLFLGTVRQSSEGRDGVIALEYETYGEIVDAEISKIVAEARSRWVIERVAVAHRLGRLTVAEVSVGVAVSAPHRPEAFAAAQYLIDELKQRAPIWKKEFWDEGEEWVGE
jgi:molybdopterin synthase catalytic subunit